MNGGQRERTLARSQRGLGKVLHALPYYFAGNGEVGVAAVHGEVDEALAVIGEEADEVRLGGQRNQHFFYFFACQTQSTQHALGLAYYFCVVAYRCAYPVIPLAGIG